MKHFHEQRKSEVISCLHYLCSNFSCKLCIFAHVYVFVLGSFLLSNAIGRQLRRNKDEVMRRSMSVCALGGGGDLAHPINSLNTSEMRFLWSMPPSKTFPPHPAFAWIQLRPNDTSAAIITYSPKADRRKRRESVLSIPTPCTPTTPRNNPHHKRPPARLPSVCLCLDHSSPKAQKRWHTTLMLMCGENKYLLPEWLNPSSFLSNCQFDIKHKRFSLYIYLSTHTYILCFCFLVLAILSLG